jgi:hypothetical protein
MSIEEFLDYHENHHSKLAERIGKPSIPNAVRNVRRYLTPVKNPVTGEIHDPGYDRMMEIWWNNIEDFETSQHLVGDPDRLPHTIEDEKKLITTHENPICLVEKHDSPLESTASSVTGFRLPGPDSETSPDRRALIVDATAPCRSYHQNPKQRLRDCEYGKSS